MGARGPRRTLRARPSFPVFRRFGETRSREPEGHSRGTMGHRRGQRDASRRYRSLVGGAHWPGSLPALWRRVATDARSWPPACLVRRASSPTASSTRSGLPGLRRLARRPAPAGHRLRRALCLAPQASAGAKRSGPDDWTVGPPLPAGGPTLGAMLRAGPSGGHPRGHGPRYGNGRSVSGAVRTPDGR